MHSQAGSILTPCVYSVLQLKRRKLKAGLRQWEKEPMLPVELKAPAHPGCLAPRGPAGAKANACWTQKAHGGLPQGDCWSAPCPQQSKENREVSKEKGARAQLSGWLCF